MLPFGVLGKLGSMPELISNADSAADGARNGEFLAAMPWLRCRAAVAEDDDDTGDEDRLGLSVDVSFHGGFPSCLMLLLRFNCSAVASVDSARDSGVTMWSL
jgi:hypothetical protein